MPGLCYETSKWLDRLWSEHLTASEPARELVKEGIGKQGEGFAGFPADLHSRLYLPSDPSGVDTAPDWAMRLHDLASELGEWNRLRAMCARNGFAAGIAAETMLEELLPHVPDRPEEEVEQSGAGAGQGEQSQDSSAGSGQDGQSPDSPGQNQQGEQFPDSPNDISLSDSDLRAALRKATRAARDAVQDAEAGLEGLAGPMGFEMPGTSVVHNAGPADLRAIREAHAKLKDNDRLKRICELAGRMERVAASKARSKVKPGVGEVHGIELGGIEDLARVLPCELGMLRMPRLRTLVLSRLLQRRALTYGMTGREPQAKGPVVVLLDESGSMRRDGKDVWSKAVALALLSTATRQKRSWQLVGFNGGITREVTIPAGRGALADVVQALDCRCAGGTDFDRPVTRAVELIRTSSTMRDADVVVISDGRASLEAGTVEAAQGLTKSEGVSWFVVGIGSSGGACCAASLGSIATSVLHVTRLDEHEVVVPVVNLEVDA